MCSDSQSQVSLSQSLSTKAKTRRVVQNYTTVESSLSKPSTGSGKHFSMPEPTGYHQSKQIQQQKSPQGKKEKPAAKLVVTPTQPLVTSQPLQHQPLPHKPTVSTGSASSGPQPAPKVPVLSMEYQENFPVSISFQKLCF